mmetsp:Transcript_18439/g.33227  ORF Transcript_18439/g.33227 Transcript_18439/m.33227 type:complete len:276 (-) Transcript_18439:1056-1883(-)
MRFGSSKPVSQDELREARNCLRLLKTKLRTEPPPYFATEVDTNAPGPAQANYRKAFKPQVKAAPPQEEEDYYNPSPPIPKKEPRRPQNYGQLEEGGVSYKFDQIDGAEGAEEGIRIPCPDCGRKFNEEAMVKHAKICKKVFMTKRKKFDISSKRAAEGAEEVPKVDEMPANRRKPAAPARAAPTKAPGKDNKWKRQSEQFRANLRAARSGDNEGYEEARRIAQEAEDEDMTRCQHCNRTFNPDVAKRHIPICERKAKEAAMKNRGSKAPAARGKR